MKKKDVLKIKLINRAHKSENDIKSEKIFSRVEIEQRTNQAISEGCLFLHKKRTSIFISPIFLIPDKIQTK
jgi:hypothetical protein